ncbi:Dorsal-ventral patterning tolloid-like protein 1 [Bulinus truncatus]|nr:Dorsal-ventral patterning tolloid-like protein 1 [Bulinus truncatus]
MRVTPLVRVIDNVIWQRNVCNRHSQCLLPDAQSIKSKNTYVSFIVDRAGHDGSVAEVGRTSDAATFKLYTDRNRSTVTHFHRMIKHFIMIPVFLVPTKSTKTVMENSLKDNELRNVANNADGQRFVSDCSTNCQKNTQMNTKRSSSQIDPVDIELSKADHMDKELYKVDHVDTELFEVIHANNEFPKIDQKDKELEILKTKQNTSRQKRAATAHKNKLWDHGVLPYVIEPIFSRKLKDVMRLAMDVWEDATCLVFKEKEPGDKDYLIFTKNTCGCCAVVGKQGNGGQNISIGKNCDKIGIVMHELGHAIGFWREHTRPDRDEYVDILIANIEQDKRNNFDIMAQSEINSLTEPYDFESIMHYSKNQFAYLPNKSTIIARLKPGTNIRPSIGQRGLLSRGDIRQTKRLYNCSACGATLRNPHGSLHYVYKPERRKECQWRIVASYGERLQLNITTVNIKHSDNCENNSLVIRDGHDIKSPLLASHCGPTVPSLVTSTGRRMLIELKTTGGLEQFSADYTTLCGGDIQKDEDVIVSPSYPHNYLPDRHCVWNITVTPGYVVVLTFEYLDLEFDDNCTNDFVEVRNGHGRSAVSLGRYCGNEHPNEIRSTGNKMSVVFISDSDINKTGFSVRFIKEMDECRTDSHGCGQVCVNTIGSFKCECEKGFVMLPDGKTCEKECGGSLYNQGNITSPFFPYNYPPNSACTWNIMTDKDRTISLNFTHFDLEGDGEKCVFDYVVVYRDGGRDTERKETFCGNIPPKPIVSDGHILKIEFKSDRYDEKSGFVAYFSNAKKGI